jgi:CRISPR-associated protein Csb3
MSEVRAPLRLPVDPTNPGQFFACCGLLELADRMWAGAEGAFSSAGREFTIIAGKELGAGSEAALLASLASCDIMSSMTDERLAVLKRLLNQGKSSRSETDLAVERELKEQWKRERITFGDPFGISVDWWSDDRSGGSSFKTWAGKQIVLDLVRGMQAALRSPEWTSLPPASNVPTGSTWCPRNGPCWNGSYRGVRPCAVTGGMETERPRQVVPRSS